MNEPPRGRPWTIRLAMLLCLAIPLLCPALLAAQSTPTPPASAIGQRVTFSSGPDRLVGSLLLPAGPGPHPAIVAIEGSGGSSYRYSWRPDAFPFWKDIAEFLVERGFAVLLFDKPGVGESTGDWKRQSFHDRGEEALAAVRSLAARRDIDGTRIGLVGHSQGGWIAQVAAARHPDDVAFLVMLAGPAVTVRRQIRDDMESVWTCRGVSPRGVAVRSAGVGAGLGLLGLVSHAARPGYLARIVNFDPAAFLPSIRQPGLAIFAGHDPLVPAASNRARMERHFGTAQGNGRLVMVTVPAADHFFRISPRCPGPERPTEWAPEFFRALEGVVPLSAR